MFCLGSEAANNYGIDCNIVDEYIQVNIKIFTFNFFFEIFGKSVFKVAVDVNFKYPPGKYDCV